MNHLHLFVFLRSSIESDVRIRCGANAIGSGIRLLDNLDRKSFRSEIVDVVPSRSVTHLYCAVAKTR